ncbi:MAG: hypothetical protein RRC34_15095 [Lentisphaeria bacterium]|nr:hypothetical protein [Lentisphaeria bacterium]
MSDKNDLPTAKSEEDIVEVIDERRRGCGPTAWICIAIVSVILILAVTFVLLKVGAVPEKMVDKVGKIAESVLKPNVHIEVFIDTAFEEMRKEAKIVVFSTGINVTERRESKKRVLWDKLNLGTTVVELRVPDNRVQYIIPTSQISRDAFRWDQDTGRLIVDVPTPVVDEDIVEVQSDPSKIRVRKDVGWARLESRSGDYLEGRIRKDLRDIVIEEANNPLLLKEARENGERVLRSLFESLMPEDTPDFKEEVPITIEYIN